MNPNAVLAAYLLWTAFAVAFAVVELRTGRVPNTAARPPVERLDLYQAAFLAGGPARVADVAILAMRASGVVHIAREGTVTATGRGPADPVTMGVLRAVTDAGGSAPLSTVRVRGARSPEVQAIGDRLLGWGLMRRPGSGQRRRTARFFVAVSVPVAVLAFFVGERDGSSSHVLVYIAGAIVGSVLSQMLSLVPRTGHARTGMSYVLRLRRGPQLVQGLDRTVAGGAGLGAVAVLGLGQLTDQDLLEVFRRERVTADATGGGAGDACGDAGGTDGPNTPENTAWCGSTSCADTGFRGSSCSGPANSCSTSWSCGSSSSSSCSSSSSSCSSGSSCGSSCGGGSS